MKRSLVVTAASMAASMMTLVTATPASADVALPPPSGGPGSPVMFVATFIFVIVLALAAGVVLRMVAVGRAARHRAKAMARDGEGHDEYGIRG